MGYEAACTLTIEGKSMRGNAQLEQQTLVFRGPIRLVIPLGAMTRATADGTTLRVLFGGREAAFDIGSQAARWAAWITSPPSRLEKLGVKPGMRVVVIALDDEEFLDELERCGVTLARRLPAASSPADAIFFGAADRKALDRLAELGTRMQPSGALWVVRPRGVKAITEAETLAAGKRAGLVDVKVVRFSDTHTAEKFVIPVARRAGSGRSRRAAGTRGQAPGRGRT